MKKLLLIGIFSVFALQLVGCEKNDNSNTTLNEETKKAEVENVASETTKDGKSDGDLSANENEKVLEGWTIKSEDEKSVVYEKNNIRAIVSTINSSETFEEIKVELKKSLNKEATIIEEKDNSIYIETNRKENIRKDIYFKEMNGKTYIFTFMIPIEHYENSLDDIKLFLEFKK